MSGSDFKENGKSERAYRGFVISQVLLIKSHAAVAVPVPLSFSQALRGKASSDGAMAFSWSQSDAEAIPRPVQKADCCLLSVLVQVTLKFDLDSSVGWPPRRTQTNKVS